MAELFGFEIVRKKPQEELPSFAPKLEEDGALVVSEGGAYGQYVDLEGAVRNEAELVSKYREISMHPDIEMAVDDIVNEAIVMDPKKEIVSLNLDDLEQPENIKKMILEEFDNTLELLEFNQHAYEIFRKWYVDGRLYYHAIIDEKAPREGIKELRYVDPRKIRKIKTQKRVKANKNTNVIINKTAEEFYIYNDKGFAKAPTQGSTYNDPASQGIRIAVDSVVNTSSGLVNVGGDMVQNVVFSTLTLVTYQR